MGWGGSRVGAGKKPKPKPFAIVARSEASAAATGDDADLLVPPADLSEDQHAFWRTHAPLAVERATLTPATVPAFRLLCELHAKKVMVGTMVDKGALGGLRVFLQLAKQVETLMARFCLAPFGKPVKVDKPKKAENPWGAFGAAK
jgi:hypothetical protein